MKPTSAQSKNYKLEKECLYCGKKFRIVAPKNYYCSISCRSKNRWKVYGKEYNSKWCEINKDKDRGYKRKWARDNLWRLKQKEGWLDRKREKDKKYRRKKGILPNISKEEQIIGKFLIEKFGKENVIFHNRTIIKNPKTNYPLELDFYIPKLKVAIEVNGICHRKPVRGGVEKLQERQRNDQIKKEECRKIGINLIIINV